MSSKIVYNYNVKRMILMFEGVRFIESENFKIVVSGDICVNLLQWRTERYKHESRSMEAILEMSMLTDSKKMGTITFAF